MKSFLVKNILVLLFIFNPFVIVSQQADSLQIDYNFINSIPQNADIFINDIYTGQTPMHFKWDTASMDNREVTLKLKGYIDFVTVFSVSDSTVNKTFKLIPFNKNYEKQTVFKNKSISFSKPLKILPMALTTVITAGSAVMAFYFKSLAIDKKEEYGITGDPALLDKKKKYDLIGGISLAVLQLGLGALIYFHFIE